MKTLCGVGLLLLAAGTLPAQNRSGFVNPGVIRRGVPSVVQPAGTSAMPGIQRTTPNVVYPAGGALQIGIPGTTMVRPNVGRSGSGRHFQNRGAYAYPIYVGGYGAYSGYPEGAYAEPMPAAPQQPNITVIYPPQQPSPVVVYGGDNQYAGPATRIFEPPAAQTAAPEEPEAVHYLIAFKDRSIYGAVAYWVDGDTLHYFTAGNTHNQASVSLVDRELTRKLNLGSGREVKLPAAK